MADGIEGRLPKPIVATLADLPEGVAEALVNPEPPRRSRVPAGGYTFGVREWGDPSGRPLLLVHGVTASSATWWRVGPALAATGRRVVSPDLPGHGQTGGWRGRHRFTQTAEDLRALATAEGLDRPDLQVIGHSWGSVVCATLPRAGLRPPTLVMVDPPAVPLTFMHAYAQDPDEQPFARMDAAAAAVRAKNPTWSEGDVLAKAEGLTEFQEVGARAVILENGDWNAGLTSLADPAAAGIPVWIVRSDEASGSLTPDAWLPALAARVGWDHILTIEGGAHSPQRMRPEATLVALLRALGD